MKKTALMIAAALSVISAYCSPVREALAARSAMTIDSEERMVEVEYLESTGTQYIVLPHVHFVTGKFRISGRVLSTKQESVYETYIGSSLHDHLNTDGICLQLWCAYYPQASYFDICGRWNNRHGSAVDARHNDSYFIIDIDTRTSSIYRWRNNGWNSSGTPFEEYKTDSRLSGPFNDNPYVLFACGQDGYDAGEIQMFWMKFYYEDEVVCDLIPVRVRDVGYMYDRVSRELFGNMGTGNFIIGPDKE